MSALVRWDAFLAQIETRHRQVLGDAEGSARQFVSQIAAGGDYTPLAHAMMQANARLLDLESMIADTWHAKVDDAITGEGNSTAIRDAAFAKGDAVRHALENARDELEPRVFAELARQRFSNALRQNRAMYCTACGAQLAAPISFRAIELPCACGARTAFEPGELMRSVAAVGTHAIAQEAVVSQWRAMRAAERRLHSIRPPRSLDVIRDVEKTQITYWWSYLAVRAKFEPELGRDPGMEVRSRMEHWYRACAEYEEAWVTAGRPRAPI
jgi:hypothetical protein